MPNELFIYGDIGESYWGDSVTEKEVAETLQSFPSSDGLDVRINTFGGDVGTGMTIMNLVRSYASKQLAMNSQFKLRSIVDGFAYSAGTLIMLAADERIMNPGSKAMTHNPLTFAYGNYKDFEKLSKEYKQHAVYMAQLYAAATGKSVDKWEQLMDDETYFTAAEAVKVGLATKEEKYEPLSSAEAASGKSRLLVPSAVYEKYQSDLDKVGGRGAYQQSLLLARASRMSLVSRTDATPEQRGHEPPAPKDTPKPEEKNPVQLVSPSSRLKLQAEYDMMVLEMNGAE